MHTLLLIALLGCASEPVPEPTWEPVTERVNVWVTLLDKYESRGWIGPSFNVRVRLPDGRLAEGAVDAEVWYVMNVGQSFPVVAEKQQGKWYINGLHRM